MSKEDFILFAMWITGYNESTIEQLLNDWVRYHRDKTEELIPPQE